MANDGMSARALAHFTRRRVVRAQQRHLVEEWSAFTSCAAAMGYRTATEGTTRCAEGTTRCAEGTTTEAEGTTNFPKGH